MKKHEQSRFADGQRVNVAAGRALAGVGDLCHGTVLSDGQNRSGERVVVVRLDDARALSLHHPG